MDCRVAPGTYWVGAGQRSEVTAIGLRFIRRVYELIAATSKCGRCGEPLGRRSRVVRSAGAHPPLWTALVATRCKGWRRHLR